MHSSLDTLEDKQAKALKEIYKLCKTEEEHASDDELTDSRGNYYNKADGGSDNS